MKKDDSPLTHKTLCMEVKRTKSVDELADLMETVKLKNVGFKIDTEAWQHAKPAELKVFETLVIHLRELIEAGKLSPPEPDRDFDDEEDLDY